MTSTELLVSRRDARLEKAPAVEEMFEKGGYRLRLHHSPSNSFQFREFTVLSLEDVIGCRSIGKSASLDIKDGRVETKKIWATHVEDDRVR